MNPFDEALQARRHALDHAFADYDPEAATRRLAARIVRERLLTSLAPAATGTAPIPDPAATVGERAAVEVEHLCRVVIARPDTATLLGDFVDHHAPAGATVFGCLLHLTGRPDAAVFWWRFAAGAEHAEAMRFLVLNHHARGEARPVYDPGVHPPRDAVPFDPAASFARDTDRRVLRAEASIESVEHPDFGEVCVPRACLPSRLEGLPAVTRPLRRRPPPTLPRPRGTSRQPECPEPH